MDPQEPRSKAPSLLTGDAPPAQASKSPERILSGLQGSSASVPKPASSRRWIWPVALLGVAVAAIILLDVGGVFEPSKPVPPPALASAPSSEPAATAVEHPTSTPAANAAPATASSATVAASKPATGGSQNAAVILADQFGPASSSSTAATTAAPAPSASSKDTAALGDMFAPHAADKKPPLVAAARTAKRGDATNGDSDVDLLAVLIKHLEVSDPTGKKHARHGKKATADEEVLPQDCPPANTEAGVACRQRFCTAHAGQGDASCPAATPGGA